MTDAFLAEIRILPYTYTPQGWAACDGQLIPISQNTALFSLIGSTYGGDGRTTMGLPNLQGRSLLSSLQGPGLPNYALGQTGGFEAVALQESQIPSHTHQPYGNKFPGTTENPGSTVLYGGESDVNYKTYTQEPTVKTPMSPSALGIEGTSLGHENRQPFLTVQFCICIDGIYPPRS